MSPAIFSDDCEETKANCRKFRYPKIEWFKGGIFSHIQLPLSEKDKIPKELLKCILCHNYNEGIDIPEETILYVKNCLNNLVKS